MENKEPRLEKEEPTVNADYRPVIFHPSFQHGRDSLTIKQGKYQGGGRLGPPRGGGSSFTVRWRGQGRVASGGMGGLGGHYPWFRAICLAELGFRAVAGEMAAEDPGRE